MDLAQGYPNKGFECQYTLQSGKKFGGAVPSGGGGGGGGVLSEYNGRYTNVSTLEHWLAGLFLFAANCRFVLSTITITINNPTYSIYRILYTVYCINSTVTLVIPCHPVCGLQQTDIGASIGGRLRELLHACQKTFEPTRYERFFTKHTTVFVFF